VLLFSSFSDHHPWPAEEYNEEFMKQSEQGSMDLIPGSIPTLLLLQIGG